MNITVLNGSPKGDMSVTLQYVRFLEKKFRQHSFSYINISQRIRKIEQDTLLFNEIISQIENSNLVIWAVPLYVCLVPSQYKRFIELIGERNVSEKFEGKYAAVMTTSIHFYDNTAHNYMRSICEDYGMRYAGGFSPDMYDIMKEENREALLNFGENIFSAAEKNVTASRAFLSLVSSNDQYFPGPAGESLDSGDKKILILSDRSYENENLGRMIERLDAKTGGTAKVMSLLDVDIRGGCMGCCECGLDYRCVYTGKDGYIDFFNSEIAEADILIFAGEIRDRYLSSKWKEMFDRAFFNTHTPRLQGKQMAFLISGPFGQIANLREILQAYSEWQEANLVDFVTDEFPSEHIDQLIDSLAGRVLDCSDKGYIQPPTFLGVGGKKVFRDDIWGRLRFVFQADHKFYGENEFYDFPQDDDKAIEINEKMIALTSNPDMREKVRKMIKTEMVKPMQYIVDNK